MVLTGWGATGVQTRQRQEQLPHFFQGLTLTQNHSDRAQQVQPDSRLSLRCAVALSDTKQALVI